MSSFVRCAKLFLAPPLGELSSKGVPENEIFEFLGFASETEGGKGVSPSAEGDQEASPLGLPLCNRSFARCDERLRALP